MTVPSKEKASSHAAGRTGKYRKGRRAVEEKIKVSGMEQKKRYTKNRANEMKPKSET